MSNIMSDSAAGFGERWWWWCSKYILNHNKKCVREIRKQLLHCWLKRIIQFVEIVSMN